MDGPWDVRSLLLYVTTPPALPMIALEQPAHPLGIVARQSGVHRSDFSGWLGTSRNKPKKTVLGICPSFASWRFQPTWKICSSKWIISLGRDENKQNIWVATTQFGKLWSQKKTHKTATDVWIKKFTWPSWLIAYPSDDENQNALGWTQINMCHTHGSWNFQHIGDFLKTKIQGRPLLVISRVIKLHV